MMELVPPVLESEHVHKVYDSIAEHFAHSRHHPWPQVTQFLNGLPVGSMVADVGTGNGKYLGHHPQHFMLGSDRSVPLLQCSGRGKNYHLLACDALQLPFRTGAFDAAISIAVLHHISTRTRRLSLLRELGRIVRVGGFIYVVAWAFEQDEKSKRKFDEQDVMVEWKLQEKYATTEPGAEHAHRDADKRWVVYQRYCHVYRSGELEELVQEVPSLEVVSVEYSRSNWCLTLKRIPVISEE